MTAMVEIGGESAVLDVISEQILAGKDSRQVAESFGVIPTALWEWMKASAPRMRAYRAAQQIRADMLVNDALNDVDTATVDDVAVAKLRADTKLKVAGKWDRETYGDGPQQGGQSGGITVIVDRDSAMSVAAPDGSVLTVLPA